MTRTSLTHPLHIATVATKPGYGRIGVTFCPGKIQPAGLSGAWSRDLNRDVQAISDWGACAVVTLVEQHELKALQVETLGDAIQARHMDWLHLPIRDVDVPGPAFEAAWIQAGEGLRDRLRAGFDIVVHCKGGLGRAGTIAARLLAELGVDSGEAIARVRAVRPGALETKAQEAHVMAIKRVPERQPDTSAGAIRDRTVGALLGLAVGDAVGTTLEFKRRDAYPRLTDMVGGGPFNLQAGEWTDDTAMALALADSLVACGELNEQDLLQRFADWWRNGSYSCTGTCFDVGVTTMQALSRWERTGASHCGSTAPNTAGNGSLMRLASVAIRFHDDRAALQEAAARQSRTTHAADEAVEACVLYAEMIADAVCGAKRSDVLKRRDGSWVGAIEAINAGSWRGKARDYIQASGYVAHSLEAALWSVGRTSDYQSAVLTAANLGQDADTTAAIAGQLSGAFYGDSGIPSAWLSKLAWRDRLTSSAEALLRRIE